MKKIIMICISVLLCCSIGLSAFSMIKLENEKREIKELKKKISSTNTNIENTISDNEKYKDKIEELKVELSEKVEEEEIWKETITNLNQALSS